VDDKKYGRENSQMANQIFMRVDEVAEALSVSQSHAYKVIKEMNARLREKGCITISGRVDRKFFYEQFYGTRDQDRGDE
jgi:predicted transcriptional regulator